MNDLCVCVCARASARVVVIRIHMQCVCMAGAASSTALYSPRSTTTIARKPTANGARAANTQPPLAIYTAPCPRSATVFRSAVDKTHGWPTPPRAAREHMRLPRTSARVSGESRAGSGGGRQRLSEMYMDIIVCEPLQWLRRSGKTFKTIRFVCHSGDMTYMCRLSSAGVEHSGR